MTNTNTPAIPKTYATALLEAGRLAHELAQQAAHLANAKEVITELCGRCLTPTELAALWSERTGVPCAPHTMNCILAAHGFQTHSTEVDPWEGKLFHHYEPTDVTRKYGYGKDVSGSRHLKRMHWRVEVLDALEESIADDMYTLEVSA